MPRLTVLSYAYPDVDAGTRVEISRNIDRKVSSLGQPVLTLVTCLRVEVAWAGGQERTADVLRGLFPTEPPPEPGHVRTDEDAFHYLCRVAAGLESPEVGEAQVLSQFRQAVRALDEAAPTSNLTAVMEGAVGVARSARRFLTPIAQESLSAAAARAVDGASPIAVLGSGVMARSVAELLNGGDVTVFARKPGPVAGHQPRPWGALGMDLGSFSAVVSTVPGGEVNLDPLVRSDVPRVLVDLGMPPAFGPAIVSRVPRYLGIDDLAADIAPVAQPATAQAAADGARSAWNRLVASERGGWIIRALLNGAEQTVEEEVSRFAHRVREAADPEAVLLQVAHNVAHRLLHAPISYVGATPLGENDLDLLAEAFGIDDG